MRSWALVLAAVLVLGSSREAKAQPATEPVVDPAAEPVGDPAVDPTAGPVGDAEPEDDQPDLFTGDDLTARPLGPPPRSLLPPPRRNLPYGTGPTATRPLAKRLPAIRRGAPGSIRARAAEAAVDPDIEPGSLTDANSGNNFFMPTALMPPAGSVGVHNYELFILGLSYAPTNYLMFSFSTLLPIADDLYVGAASAKVQVYRGPVWRLAVHGGALFGSDGDGNDDGLAAGSIGAAATACLDDGCASHFSAFSALALIDDDNSVSPLLFSGGVVLRLSDSARLLAELDVGTASNDSDIDGVSLFWYGVRFTSRKLSTDFGFVRPLVEDSSELFPLGFPMVIFNYRS